MKNRINTNKLVESIFKIIRAGAYKISAKYLQGRSKEVQIMTREACKLLRSRLSVLKRIEIKYYFNCYRILVVNPCLQEFIKYLLNCILLQLQDSGEIAHELDTYVRLELRLKK